MRRDVPSPAREKKSRASPSPAREKKGRAGGQLLAGLGQGGTAARPLDGGVLTHWGARMLARWPAMAPWSLHRLARSRSVSSLRLREEWKAAKRERRERKGRGLMALGLRGAEQRWGFDWPKCPLGRPIGFNGARCTGRITA